MMEKYSYKILAKDKAEFEEIEKIIEAMPMGVKKLLNVASKTMTLVRFQMIKQYEKRMTVYILDKTISVVDKDESIEMNTDGVIFNYPKNDNSEIEYIVKQNI